MTFITFEGGEGAGKSTQALKLAGALRAAGYEVVATREPGGTPGAEAIRRLLLNPATILTPMADMLLHFAARADHVDRLISPALARGAIVLCDRFYDSTLAYQGYGLGLNLATIQDMISRINITPSLTFILDVSETVAKTRLASRDGKADRYEMMGDEVMSRIAGGFRAIAAAEPRRCVVIDASGDEAAVFGTVLHSLRVRLNLP